MPRRERDPFGSFRFVLELGNVQVAGFSECTGLQMETKILEYMEGGRNHTTLKFPDPANYGNITLKRGLTQSNELIEWQLDIIEGRFGKNPRTDDFVISIILKNEKGDDVKRWNLVRPFPVKWVGPDLKSANSDLAIESLEIAHEGIQIG